MHLEGSCHCGAVRFSLESAEPCPFLLCYCSICRKTAGGGGYAINLGGDFKTLEVTGRDHLGIYRPWVEDPDSGERVRSPGERVFCRECGSALWAWDPRWPDLMHPHASAIDSELPAAPGHTHMMLGSKAGWVPVHAAADDRCFPEYPDESLAEWHRRMGLETRGG